MSVRQNPPFVSIPPHRAPQKIGESSACHFVAAYHHSSDFILCSYYADIRINLHFPCIDLSFLKTLALLVLPYVP
jgi:hypothetical protein